MRWIFVLFIFGCSDKEINPVHGCYTCYELNYVTWKGHAILGDGFTKFCGTRIKIDSLENTSFDIKTDTIEKYHRITCVRDKEHG
jgi:hypothetical protein